MTATVYCIEDFKKKFEKLLRKKSYQHLEHLIIDFFFNKNTEELNQGARLNNNRDVPFVKKRIPDSGGFRFYYLLFWKKIVFI